jgi:hypothetical protein
MNPMTGTSKLLRICFIDGTPIGEINLNGSNGTYLHKFKLYKGYSNNLEIKKIHILNTGTDYIGFSQKQYLTTIKNGLGRAFGMKVKFEEKIPKTKAKKLLRK